MDIIPIAPHILRCVLMSLYLKKYDIRLFFSQGLSYPYCLAKLFIRGGYSGTWTARKRFILVITSEAVTTAYCRRGLIHQIFMNRHLGTNSGKWWLICSCKDVRIYFMVVKCSLSYYKYPIASLIWPTEMDAMRTLYLEQIYTKISFFSLSRTRYH